jgi:hypothetical protein
MAWPGHRIHRRNASALMVSPPFTPPCSPATQLLTLRNEVPLKR